MPRYTLRINGRPEPVEAAPETPLLWVLRDHLGLVGTKYGCGVGQCGACTVHVDGRPTRACLTPVASVGSRPVRTIEGLDPRGQHPVQQAWLALDVPQCGYCQAGQIMSAVALLERRPRPDDAEIDAALSGHLCRCGTYTRIRAAVHEAAQRSAALARPAVPSRRES